MTLDASQHRCIAPGDSRRPRSARRATAGALSLACVPPCCLNATLQFTLTEGDVSTVATTLSQCAAGYCTAAAAAAAAAADTALRTRTLQPAAAVREGKECGQQVSVRHALRRQRSEPKPDVAHTRLSETRTAWPGSRGLARAGGGRARWQAGAAAGCSRPRRQSCIRQAAAPLSEQAGHDLQAGRARPT